MPWSQKIDSRIDRNYLWNQAIDAMTAEILRRTEGDTLEKIILTAQEDIEISSVHIYLLQSHRRAIATAIQKSIREGLNVEP